MWQKPTVYRIAMDGANATQQQGTATREPAHMNGANKYYRSGPSTENKNPTVLASGMGVAYANTSEVEAK